jgi:hypothetical protein
LNYIIKTDENGLLFSSTSKEGYIGKIMIAIDENGLPQIKDIQVMPQF